MGTLDPLHCRISAEILLWLTLYEHIATNTNLYTHQVKYSNTQRLMHTQTVNKCFCIGLFQLLEFRSLRFHKGQIHNNRGVGRPICS